MTRHAWIDASAGVAGDMLLGALLDAGAELAAVRGAVAAVVGDAVRIDLTQVTRAGLRAAKAEVVLQQDDPPHRHWTDVRAMITEAELDDAVRADAILVFQRLAEAEGRVHGVPAEDIAFHEVGALDSIADVVGVCAAVHDLGVQTITAGLIALGSGRVRAAHGSMPVPVPAVADLAGGWRVGSGGDGELTTPTGMALIAALAEDSEELPPMVVQRTGIGAGSRDVNGRANVTRVVLGEREATASAPASSSGLGEGEPALVLEANLDDLDPRLWPGVLTALLDAGADDAWLTPILMKKGRPAHTLSVLCSPGRAAELRTMVIESTTTFGVRESSWTKYPLPRLWRRVAVGSATVAVKIAHRDGVVVRVNPEFDEVAALAAALDRPVLDVLNAALAAADGDGLRPGERLPDLPASG